MLNRSFIAEYFGGYVKAWMFIIAHTRGLLYIRVGKKKILNPLTHK